MSEANRTLRNTLYSSVALYTEFSLGLVTSILIARHLGPDQYGIYSGIVWMVALGIAMTNSGTASAVIRFTAQLHGSGERGQVRPVIGRLRAIQLRYLLVVATLAGLALWIAGDRLLPGLDHRLLFAFLVLAVALRSSYMFNIGIAKGMQGFRVNAVVAAIASPLNLLLVLLVALSGRGLAWYLGAFLLSGAVFWALSLQRTRPLERAFQPDPALDPELLARLRRQVWYSTLIVSIGFLTASEMEVVFLNAHALPEAAGHFKVAHQLATGAATLVPGVFAGLMLPMMASALGRGTQEAGQRFTASTTYLALLGLPLAAFGAVFGGSIIAALYGPQYQAAGPVFSLLLACTCLLSCTAAASSLLISADRQQQVFVVLAACAVLKFVLDAVAIRHWQLWGAAGAFATVAVANALATLLLAARVARASPDWNTIARVALAALLAAAVAAPALRLQQPVAAVLLGGLLFALAYAACTLLLGCWRASDIAQMQVIQARVTRGHARPVDLALSWAHARALRNGRVC